jgi:hypothetical protein
MAKARLRIYYGPEESSCPSDAHDDVSPRRTVELPLSEVFPVLADAVQSRRTWLRDFEDDMVTISSDLYEVILAYQHYRRPPA